MPGRAVLPCLQLGRAPHREMAQVGPGVPIGIWGTLLSWEKFLINRFYLPQARSLFLTQPVEEHFKLSAFIYHQALSPAGPRLWFHPGGRSLQELGPGQLSPAGLTGPPAGGPSRPPCGLQTTGRRRHPFGGGLPEQLE